MLQKMLDSAQAKTTELEEECDELKMLIDTESVRRASQCGSVQNFDKNKAIEMFMMAIEVISNNMLNNYAL